MNEERMTTIASHQQRLQDLVQIKERIEKSDSEKIRFKIETKHWYGYAEPIKVKTKDTLQLDKYTAKLILDIATKIEKQKIDNLIDIEIEERENRKESE